MKFNFNEIRVLPKRIGNAVQKIGRRNLAIACAVLMIAGAILLNYKMFSSPVIQGTLYYQGQSDKAASGEGENNGDQQAGGQGTEVDNYFTSTILNRQKSRDEALAVLRLIVDKEDALPESVSDAISKMNQIARDMEQEANIETLVKAKGFAECVAVISEGNCTVIVKSEGLLPNEIAQIQEIVYEQSGILPERVKMVEKKG